MFSTRSYGIVSLLLSCCITAPVWAERSDSFGDYQIHYNALTTDLIGPSVARAYNIIRSKDLALVNIAVLRRVLGTPLQPVRATVKVEAVNLNSQLRTMEIRELNDAGAIYYIGEIPVSHKETLIFKLEVTPESEEATYTTTFKQAFYTE